MLWMGRVVNWISINTIIYMIIQMEYFLDFRQM